MAKNIVKDEFIVALDIGTTKVLCLVADYDEDGELRLVGIGQEACSVLNKGVISEIDATVKSIRKAPTAIGSKPIKAFFIKIKELPQIKERKVK